MQHGAGSGGDRSLKASPRVELKRPIRAGPGIEVANLNARKKRCHQRLK